MCALMVRLRRPLAKEEKGQQEHAHNKGGALSHEGSSVRLRAWRAPSLAVGPQVHHQGWEEAKATAGWGRVGREKSRVRGRGLVLFKGSAGCSQHTHRPNWI